MFYLFGRPLSRVFSPPSPPFSFDYQAIPVRVQAPKRLISGDAAECSRVWIERIAAWLLVGPATAPTTCQIRHRQGLLATACTDVVRPCLRTS